MDIYNPVGEMLDKRFGHYLHVTGKNNEVYLILFQQAKLQLFLLFLGFV